ELDPDARQTMAADIIQEVQESGVSFAARPSTDVSRVITALRAVRASAAEQREVIEQWARAGGAWSYDTATTVDPYGEARIFSITVRSLWTMETSLSDLHRELCGDEAGISPNAARLLAAVATGTDRVPQWLTEIRALATHAKDGDAEASWQLALAQ